MKKTTKKTLSSLFAAVIATSLSLGSPVSAATVNSWGEWQYASEVDTSHGVINFSTGQINASWASTGASVLDTEILSTNSDGEFMDRYTPIASAFSANSSSINFNYLKAYASADDRHIVTVTFDTPVPAGNLGIAVSDIDSDQVTISATTDGTTAATAEEIAGTSIANKDTLAFNFCAHRTTGPCSNDTAVVPVNFMQDEVKFGDLQNGDLWGTDGSSGWVHPTVAIKTIRFYIENADLVNSSSERIWLVQKNQQAGTGLANTGSNSQDGLLIAGSLIMAGIAVRIGSTFRRRSESHHRA